MANDVSINVSTISKRNVNYNIPTPDRSVCHIKYKSYVNYNNYNGKIQTLNECTTNRNSTIQQNMLCIYSNVDCLPNKIQELKSLIELSEKVPDIIALTEVKNKRKRNFDYTDKLKIDGYRLFHNDLLREGNRGIIVYVKQGLRCKRKLFLYSSFMEYILLEIETDHKVMHIATIYRSPNSSFENSLNMCSLIDHICTKPGYKLFLGDFNFPKIDWNHMESKKTSRTRKNEVHEPGSRTKFIDTLQKNKLKQHIINFPTRARGNATPHILDLIITKSNESFIEKIEFDAPLGKSDHSIIRVSCKVNPKISTEKESRTKLLDVVDLKVKNLISEKNRLWMEYIKTEDKYKKFKKFNEYKTARDAVCKEIN